MFNPTIFTLTMKDITTIYMLLTLFNIGTLGACVITLIQQRRMEKEFKEQNQAIAKEMDYLREKSNEYRNKLQDDLLDIKSMKNQYQQYLEKYKLIIEKIQQIKINK